MRRQMSGSVPESTTRNWCTSFGREVRFVGFFGIGTTLATRSSGRCDAPSRVADAGCATGGVPHRVPARRLTNAPPYTGRVRLCQMLTISDITSRLGMRAEFAMNVSLTPELERLVNEKVE